MFWDSVVGGLKVLTYWETYVAGLMYFAIISVPMLLAGIAMRRSETGYGGCLMMLLMPAVQVVAMVIVTLTLSPIILGFSDGAAWAYPWQLIGVAPIVFLGLIGKLLVTAILLAFIPLIGQLQSLYTLVIGGVALAFTVRILQSGMPGDMTVQIDLIPGLWFIVGLVLIGGALSFVGLMVAGAIASAGDAVEEGFGQLIIMPMGAVLGLIPVFMYGAWLGMQFQGGG